MMGRGEVASKCCRDGEFSASATLGIGKCERRILTYLSTRDDGTYQYLSSTFDRGDELNGYLIPITRSMESSYMRAAHRLERLGFIDISKRGNGAYPKTRMVDIIRLTDKGRSWLRDREYK